MGTFAEGGGKVARGTVVCAGVGEGVDVEVGTTTESLEQASSMARTMAVANRPALVLTAGRKGMVDTPFGVGLGEVYSPDGMVAIPTTMEPCPTEQIAGAFVSVSQGWYLLLQFSHSPGHGKASVRRRH